MATETTLVRVPCELLARLDDLRSCIEADGRQETAGTLMRQDSQGRRAKGEISYARLIEYLLEYREKAKVRMERCRRRARAARVKRPKVMPLPGVPTPDRG